MIQQLEHCLEIMKYLLLVFFDGEEVIAYKTLVSYENDQSVLIDHQDIKRRRDIVKKQDGMSYLPEEGNHCPDLP